MKKIIGYIVSGTLVAAGLGAIGFATFQAGAQSVEPEVQIMEVTPPGTYHHIITT